MLRAYKYRIYPTDEQKIMLAKTFGCCRLAYNWALELKEKAYKESSENISQYDMEKRIVYELKEEKPFLGEVSANAIAFAVEDLYEGYKNFREHRAKKPKFRTKHQRQHYHDRGTVKADFEHNFITLPKIKNIPCIFHRRFRGRIKQAGVELLPSGRYNVSILVDTKSPLPEKKPIDPDKTLGIDTGLKHFAVLSDGQTYEPTHYAKQEKRKLKLLSRRLEKKQKGSKQFRVLKHRIARLQERVANRRKDHLHKITHYLAYENQGTTICVEDLNVEGMRHNKHLAYSISDAGIGEFYRQLKYKCEWTGKNLIKIDRFAPSSKMCSHCGYIYKRLTLDEREWTCPECGTHHDRDLNAAINIKNLGLGLTQTLPSVRREVKPVEQPLVDDRSPEPKKPCQRKTARRVRADEQRRSRCYSVQTGSATDETGKVRSNRAPMPKIDFTSDKVQK